MKIKCEICGIKTCRIGDKKRTFMARFPLYDEDRCKQWVKATGNQDLAYVPIEKLHKLKYICEKHFRSKDFKKKKTQLRKNAVPTLFLSSPPLPDEILVDFPLHVATTSESTHTRRFWNPKKPNEQHQALVSPVSGQFRCDQESNARDPSPDFPNVEEAPIHSPEFLNEEECNSNTKLMDVSPITSVEYGSNLQENIASSFEHIATTGLDEQTRKEFIKKNPIPNNCTAIYAPSLTPEIKATLTEQVLKQDEAIEGKQKQLAAAISSIGRVICDQIFNSKVTKADLVNQLMATGHILCDLQYSESLARYNNINSSKN